MKLTLALTLLAATAAPKPDATPKADVPALVARCVAAYGGKEGLARSAVTRQEGRVTSLLHPGQDGRIARAYVRPGKLRVETAWPDGNGEIRVLDGGHGWRDGEEVSGPRLAAMMLQAARMDVPALLSAWVAKVEDRGPGEVEGRPVRILSLKPAPGLLVEAGIDVATGRVLRSRSSSVDPACRSSSRPPTATSARSRASSCRSTSGTGRTGGRRGRRSSRR